MTDDCPYLSEKKSRYNNEQHLFCAWCPCAPPCPDGEWKCELRSYVCPVEHSCACHVQVLRDWFGWDGAHERWLEMHERKERAEGVYAMARWYEHKRAIERKCKYSGGNTCSVCGKRIRNDSIWCPSCAQTVKVERARMRKVAA